MGYYISTPNSIFSIRNADLPKFFRLVDDLMSDQSVDKNGSGGSYSGGKKNISWFSWVNTDLVRLRISERDIVGVFEQWGYELRNMSTHDDITTYDLDIRNGNAKIGDEEKFFAAIAPVVDDGSFIDVRGEDGIEWRWMWENGKFYSQDVIEKQIIFGNPVEIPHNVSQA
jgi:hypothetical protein